MGAMKPSDPSVACAREADRGFTEQVQVPERPKPLRRVQQVRERGPFQDERGNPGAVERVENVPEDEEAGAIGRPVLEHRRDELLPGVDRHLDARPGEMHVDERRQAVGLRGGGEGGPVTETSGGGPQLLAVHPVLVGPGTQAQHVRERGIIHAGSSPAPGSAPPRGAGSGPATPPIRR